MGTCSKSIRSDPDCTDRPNLSYLQQNNLQLRHLQQMVFSLQVVYFATNGLAASGLFRCKWSLQVVVIAANDRCQWSLQIILLQMSYFCCKCPILLEVTWCKWVSDVQEVVAKI